MTSNALDTDLAKMRWFASLPEGDKLVAASDIDYHYTVHVSESEAESASTSSSEGSRTPTKALIDATSNPSLVKLKCKSNSTNLAALLEGAEDIPKLPATPDSKSKMFIIDREETPLERPELEKESLIRVVSDVQVQIEMACSTWGYFDDVYSPPGTNAYEPMPIKQLSSKELLVGNAKVDACLYEPLKNFEMVAINFLNLVDTWGARGRFMETITIPNINRVINRVSPSKGNECGAAKMIRQLLKDNDTLNPWYINTFAVHARDLEDVTQEMRGLVELLSLICDHGNASKAQFNDFINTSNKRKASDAPKSKMGMDKATSTKSSPINTKTSSSYIKGDVDSDLAAAVKASLTSFRGPTPEPMHLRTSNRNISGLTFGPEPLDSKEPFVYALGPTEENLARMTLEEHVATRYDDTFYALKCTPEYLAALSGVTRNELPLYKKDLPRAEHLEKLKTTPEWKKKLSDRHFIDDLHVNDKEIEIFEEALELAKKALAKAEECAETVKKNKETAEEMMLNYDLYKDHADELEVRGLNRGAKEAEKWEGDFET